jgi:hypothetical protein
VGKVSEQPGLRSALSKTPRGQPLLKRPFSCRSPKEAAGRLPLQHQRPRHALSSNSLISNPLPPSRTQSLQPDFPQPSETREISAVGHEPDSSWRCSENCCCLRNNTGRRTSAQDPALLLLPLEPLPPLF